MASDGARGARAGGGPLWIGRGSVDGVGVAEEEFENVLKSYEMPGARGNPEIIAVSGPSRLPGSVPSSFPNE
jgi:hypothetical protein